MNISQINKYIKMQKDFYQPTTPKHAKSYVGVGDVIWTPNVLDGLRDRLIGHQQFDKGVDFGCGVGRMIAHFHNQFNHIDGVDIAPKMLKYAKQYLTEQQVPQDKYALHENNLYLYFLKSDSYDIVYSYITIHHICVWEIRNIYLSEFYRILKPGGHIAIELFGGLNFDVPAANKWYDNNYDAVSTNSFNDVKLENPYFLVNDLLAIGYKNDIQLSFRQVDPFNNGRARHEFSLLVKAWK